MIDYSLILSTNYLGKKWVFKDYDYAGLEWFDESPKPTQAELDALWESTQATVAEQKAQAIAIKESALAKLAELGLTQDEVKALIG
jgi:hypothetical protein